MLIPGRFLTSLNSWLRLTKGETKSLRAESSLESDTRESYQPKNDISVPVDVPSVLQVLMTMNFLT